MKQFCEQAILTLDACIDTNWAITFIKLKLEFFHKFQNNLILSTVHGIDFFHNILNCLNGEPWSVKEHKGIYEDNFRTLISTY